MKLIQPETYTPYALIISFIGQPSEEMMGNLLFHTEPEGKTIPEGVRAVVSFVVKNFEEAMTCMFQRGLPNRVHVLTNYQEDENVENPPGCNEFIQFWKTQLELFEKEYKFLQEPVVVTCMIENKPKQSQGWMDSFMRRMRELSSNYQEGPVMLRRHQEVMKRLAPHFEVFMRRGVYGRCIQCPRVVDGHGVTHFFPEQCGESRDHDHNYPAERLFGSYQHWMKTPFKE